MVSSHSYVWDNPSDKWFAMIFIYDIIHDITYDIIYNGVNNHCFWGLAQKSWDDPPSIIALW